MAIIPIEVPNTRAEDLKASFGHPEWTNLELATYLRRWLAEHLKLHLKAYYRQVAMDAAEATVAEPNDII